MYFEIHFSTNAISPARWTILSFGDAIRLSFQETDDRAATQI